MDNDIRFKIMENRLDEQLKDINWRFKIMESHIKFVNERIDQLILMCYILLFATCTALIIAFLI